jgi:hypothetical protein
LVQIHRDLAAHLGVRFGGQDLEQLARLGGVAVEAVELLDAATQAGSLLRQLLGCPRVIPQGGVVEARL